MDWPLEETNTVRDSDIAIRRRRWPILGLVVRVTLPLTIQVWIILTCLAWYRSIGQHIVPSRALAFEHARWIIHLEERLHLSIEPDLQSLTSNFGGGLARQATAWNYTYGYLSRLLAALFWLFLFRRERFGVARDIVLLCLPFPLIIYVLYPLAPPRYAMSSPPWSIHDWTANSALANHLTSGAVQSVGYNPFAAMPSVHVLWSILACVTLVIGLRRVWLRLLAACSPLTMIFTVIVTGNHYVLDCLAAGVIVASSAGLVIMLHGLGGVIRRFFAFRGRLPLARAARLGLIARITERLTMPRGPLAVLEAPLWLCAAICAPALLLRDTSRLLLMLVLLVAVVVMLAPRVPALRAGLGRGLRQIAPLTDGVAGLLFVCGAAGLIAPPGAAATFNYALWIAAGLLALLGRLPDTVRPSTR